MAQRFQSGKHTKQLKIRSKLRDQLLVGGMTSAGMPVTLQSMQTLVRQAMTTYLQGMMGGAHGGTHEQNIKLQFWQDGNQQ
eukprot:2345214-Karenia_brevis.AAC.1